MTAAAVRLFKALRDTGVAAQGFTTVRRLRAINVVAMTAVTATLIYAVFYAAYDTRHFARELMVLAVAVAVYAATFLITRAGRPNLAFWYLASAGLLHLGTISWLLGAGSGVANYLLIVPVLLALVAGERDRFSVWPVALAAGGLFVLLGLVKPAGSFAALPDAVQQWFFAANTFGALLVVSGFAVFFRWLIMTTEARLEAERRRSDRLLLAILPAPVARQLKQDETRTIARGYPEATAVFADIAGFTAWSMQAGAAEVVAELNRIFSRLDEMAEVSGIEKLKTIGDAYFAVCGLPEPVPDHSERVADFALDLCAWAAAHPPGSLQQLRFRVVISRGPVVAGVIGRSKFAYDAWGNAINAAARLESHCAPGEILMTAAAAASLPERFRLEPVGRLELKGQGQAEVFRLCGRS